MDASNRIAKRLGTWEEHPDGTLSVQRVRYKGATAAFLRIFGVPPTLTVHLDQLGSSVWRAMDGRTVGAILEHLKVEYEGEEDLGVRLGQYLSTLVSNRLAELTD